MGYQYVITNQNHSLEGRWEVAYKGTSCSFVDTRSANYRLLKNVVCAFLPSTGSMQVFLPPEGLAKLGDASPTQDNVFCAQLQRFQIKSMNERGLHSWHAENCYKKFPFLCKRSTCPCSLFHQKCRHLFQLRPSHTRSVLNNVSVDLFVCCCPDRANVRGHQRQRRQRGLLLHPQGGRPVSELHVPRGRARDVRGGAVRASAGLPALPQRSQRVLQVHLPGPRYRRQSVCVRLFPTSQERR